LNESQVMDPEIQNCMREGTFVSLREWWYSSWIHWVSWSARWVESSNSCEYFLTECELWFSVPSEQSREGMNAPMCRGVAFKWGNSSSARADCHSFIVSGNWFLLLWNCVPSLSFWMSHGKHDDPKLWVESILTQKKTSTRMWSTNRLKG
jgi:hypothetical protein